MVYYYVDKTFRKNLPFKCHNHPENARFKVQANPQFPLSRFKIQNW